MGKRILIPLVVIILAIFAIKHPAESVDSMKYLAHQLTTFVERI